MSTITTQHATFAAAVMAIIVARTEHKHAAFEVYAITEFNAKHFTLNEQFEDMEQDVLAATESEIYCVGSEAAEGYILALYFATHPDAPVFIARTAS